MRQRRKRGLFQIESTYTEVIINSAEHLNTKYKQDQFVNSVTSQHNNQPCINSTNEIAAKDAEKLNKTNDGNNKKKGRRKGMQHTKVRLGKVLKERQCTNKRYHRGTFVQPLIERKSNKCYIF